MAHVTGHPKEKIGVGTWSGFAEEVWPHVKGYVIPPKMAPGGLTEEEQRIAADIGLGDVFNLGGTKKPSWDIEDKEDSPSSPRKVDLDSQDLTRDERGYQRWQPRVTGPGPVPAAPTPDESFEIKDPAYGFILSKIARLGSIENPTNEQLQELNDLYAQKEAIEAKGGEGSFWNEVLQSILPSIFTQQYDQRESDRDYKQTMQVYQDKQQQIREDLEREQGKRREAFLLIPKLFPNLDLDLSSFGGEIDPDILPSLIQMAQLRSREKMDKQQQRVARPIIRFA